MFDCFCQVLSLGIGSKVFVASDIVTGFIVFGCTLNRCFRFTFSFVVTAFVSCLRVFIRGIVFRRIVIRRMWLVPRISFVVGAFMRFDFRFGLLFKIMDLDFGFRVFIFPVMILLHALALQVPRIDCFMAGVGFLQVDFDDGICVGNMVIAIAMRDIPMHVIAYVGIVDHGFPKSQKCS